MILTFPEYHEALESLAMLAMFPKEAFPEQFAYLLVDVADFEHRHGISAGFRRGETAGLTQEVDALRSAIGVCEKLATPGSPREVEGVQKRVNARLQLERLELLLAAMKSSQ